MPPLTSSNMNLSTPISGENDYPTSVANSFTAIDAHDHSSGKGVPLPTTSLSGQITTAQITDLNVTTAKIAALNVTRAKIEAVGQQVSSSSGTFSSSSTTFIDVTNLTVTITTSGRPVCVGLMADGLTTSPDYSAIQVATPPATDISFDLMILRGASEVTHLKIGQTGILFVMPPSIVHVLDVVAAGTYTYKIQVKANVASESMAFNNIKMYAYEL